MQVMDLKRSGQSTILIETLHAIVGTIALQNGGDAASTLIRERILKTPSPSEE